MDVINRLNGNCFFCADNSFLHCCSMCELAFFTPIARCPVCARQQAAGLICGQCLQSVCLFDSCTVITDYCYPVDRFIQAIKYGSRPELLFTLSSLLAKRIKTTGFPLPELLIPVPLHPERQHVRGFNQALLLTKQLSRLCGIPFEENAIVRVKNTKPQSLQDLSSRKQNVINAFEQRHKINTAHIAIVDDVITSGATVSAISKLLRKQGCEEIEVWALARPPLD